MEFIAHDMRYALRMMVKTPAFTIIAIVTLALGIGADVAIFSYVDEMWLRPMPVPHADRVMRIFTSNPSSGGEIEHGLSSYPDFEDLRTSAKDFSGVALYEGRGAMLDDGVQNKLVTVGVVSDNFFDVLQPSAAVGHLPSAEESRDPSSVRVVLSYPFWRSQYNADPSIVGRSIIVDRQHVTVLGVLPRSFRGPESMMVRDLWIPMTSFLTLRGERDRLTKRDFRDYELFGRLQDGVSLQQAQAELSGVAAQLAAAYPATNSGRKISVIPEREVHGEDAKTTGLLLLGVAGLVLLIACSNVASLMIARTEYRRQEIATRIALGASRARIIRQFLTETILLAGIGALAALLLGGGLLKLLPSLMPQMSFSVGVDAYLNSRALVVAFGLSVASIFLFGMVPALLASRMVPTGELKQRGAQGSKVRPAIRTGLVVTQVALSLVLVIGAVLLVRSMLNGLALDPGFNAHQNMLVLDVAPDAGRAEQDMAFVKEARRRIEDLPGVVGTAVGMRIPFGMSGSGATHKVFVPGSLVGTAREGATINFDPVSDRFFEVLGTRILRGRAIDQRDLELNARVVVVNQQMAGRFWPNEDPIGKRVRLDRVDGDEYEVIGVAEDGKYNDFQEDAMPYFFMPMKADDYGEVALAIKTIGSAGALATPVRQILRDMNHDVAILDLLTLRQHIRQALYDQQVMAGLITALGALGLVLAAVGIYGLMAFLVGRRTQEIGIRMALGAQRGRIFSIVLRQALTMTAVGTVVGAVAALAATRLLRTLLLGVAPTDIVALAIGASVLLLAALVAAVIPAMAAARVDPMKALRYE